MLAFNIPVYLMASWMLRWIQPDWSQIGSAEIEVWLTMISVVMTFTLLLVQAGQIVWEIVGESEPWDEDGFEAWYQVIAGLALLLVLMMTCPLVAAQLPAMVGIDLAELQLALL